MPNYVEKVAGYLKKSFKRSYGTGDLTVKGAQKNLKTRQQRIDEAVRKAEGKEAKKEENKNSY